MFFVDVILDAVNHPVSTLYLITSLWIGIKIIHGFWKVENFAISYKDCVQNNQVWRFTTSTFSHDQLPHLIYDIIMIWTCRPLEDIYGAFYFLRYSILLMLLEPIFTIFMAYFFGWIQHIAFLSRQGASSPNTVPFNPRNSELYSTKFCGSSGVLLAWLTYASIDSLQNSSYKNYQYYYMFGFFPISWLFVPIFIAILIPIVAGRSNAISNITGLLLGYMMIFGLIQILPNIYWTICFLINFLLLLTSHTANSEFNNNSDTNSMESNERTVVEGSWNTPARSLYNANDEVYHVPSFNQYIPPLMANNDVELAQTSNLSSSFSSSSSVNAHHANVIAVTGDDDSEEHQSLLTTATGASRYSLFPFSKKPSATATTKDRASDSSSSGNKRNKISASEGFSLFSNMRSTSQQQKQGGKEYFGLPHEADDEEDNDNNDDMEKSVNRKKYDDDEDEYKYSKA